MKAYNTDSSHLHLIHFRASSLLKEITSFGALFRGLPVREPASVVFYMSRDTYCIMRAHTGTYPQLLQENLGTCFRKKMKVNEPER